MFLFLLCLRMSVADSSEDNQNMSDVGLPTELTEINAFIPPLYVIREMQVELGHFALALNVDQIANCTDAAVKARRFASFFMATQFVVPFCDVEEKQHAWMELLSQEYRDDKVQLEASVLHQEKEISSVYLKSMIKSTLLWSAATIESIRNMQVELQQFALAFDVDLVPNCTEAASKARRFVIFCMARQSQVPFLVIDEQRHAWMETVAEEYRDDKVVLESSILYLQQKLSCVYLKSMIKSTLLWSGAIVESVSQEE